MLTAGKAGKEEEHWEDAESEVRSASGYAGHRATHEQRTTAVGLGTTRAKPPSIPVPCTDRNPHRTQSCSARPQRRVPDQAAGASDTSAQPRCAAPTMLLPPRLSPSACADAPARGAARRPLPRARSQGMAGLPPARQSATLHAARLRSTAAPATHHAGLQGRGTAQLPRSISPPAC